jgi:hypothetical protein
MINIFKLLVQLCETTVLPFLASPEMQWWPYIAISYFSCLLRKEHMIVLPVLDGHQRRAAGGEANEIYTRAAAVFRLRTALFGFTDSYTYIYKPQQAKVLFALTVHLCGIASLLQSLMKSRRVLLHSSQRIPVHLLFITTKAWY